MPTINPLPGLRKALPRHPSTESGTETGAESVLARAIGGR
jgi:hypothetical protein